MAVNQVTNAIYTAVANLNLWIKLQSNSGLSLTDVPEIIPSRWTYLRDNWDLSIKNVLQQLVPSYSNPDYLNKQIIDFSKFVEIQLTSNLSNNPFNDLSQFYKYYTIFDNILINNIQITDLNQALIDTKVATIQAYTKNDFVKIKNIVTQARDAYADYIGLTDATYNAAYSRNPIPPNVAASIEEINQLQVYQNTLDSVNFILSNLFQVDAVLDHFALAIANANNPEINIGQYSSGYLTKINYGDDLEDVATQYLGDPNKWIDIAIANGLKEPYIDEVGVAIPLLANGNGNQINISGTDPLGDLNINLLFINQVVILQSATQVFPDQRTIVNLKVIPVSGEIVIQLDGAPNLGNYLLADQANMRVFAANTINSKFMILIPSQDPLPSPRTEEVPWFLAKSAQDEKNCGIDLALNPSGDLVFNSTADLELSYGLDNGIQALKLKMQTEKGTLRYHPEFGLLNLVGSKNTQSASLIQLLTDSIVQSVNSDPRFNRLNSITVKALSGASGFQINMVVQLAGGSSVLVPISFSVTI
jgi:hypothetical protein